MAAKVRKGLEMIDLLNKKYGYGHWLGIHCSVKKPEVKKLEALPFIQWGDGYKKAMKSCVSVARAVPSANVPGSGNYKKFIEFKVNGRHEGRRVLWVTLWEKDYDIEFLAGRYDTIDCKNVIPVDIPIEGPRVRIDKSLL